MSVANGYEDECNFMGTSRNFSLEHEHFVDATTSYPFSNINLLMKIMENKAVNLFIKLYASVCMFYRNRVKVQNVQDYQKSQSKWGDSENTKCGR